MGYVSFSSNSKSRNHTVLFQVQELALPTLWR
jgi:hypothetical protein